MSDMSQSTSAGPRRTRRWVWWLLVGSLALNLLIVGVIGGAFWAVRSGGMWDAPTVAARSFQFMQSLPEETRSEVRSVLRSYWDRVSPNVRELRATRRDLARLVSTDPLDDVALRQALDALRQKENALRLSATDMLINSLKRLPASRRVDFLRTFARHGVEISCAPGEAGLERGAQAMRNRVATYSPAHDTRSGEGFFQ